MEVSHRPASSSVTCVSGSYGTEVYILGAYSKPGLSPPAEQPARISATVAIATRLLITRIKYTWLFKILFIDFFRTGFPEQSRQVILTLALIQSKIDRHDVLVVGAPHVKLARFLVGFKITDDKERGHHTQCRKQDGHLERYRNKRRKRSEILPTDDHWPVIPQHPVLHY